MTSETMTLLYLVPQLDSEYIDIYIKDDKLCFTGIMYDNGTYLDRNNMLREYYVNFERTIRISIQIWNCTK